MKKFVMGLILGVGLTFTVSAYAEEVVNLVGSTIDGQFPVKVDGKTITSPGIVINGTSYLPTRTIAELAGYEVSFDADMGVELTKNVTKASPQTSEDPRAAEFKRLQAEYEKAHFEMVEFQNKEVHLRHEIIRIQDAEPNRDIRDLETQLAEYQSKIEELRAKRDDFQTKRDALLESAQ